MLTKTKVVLAAALMLGTASVAMAGDSGENSQGGYVVPGSTDGVNPVYHPDLFSNSANTGNGGKAYGFAPAPKQTHRASQQQTQDSQAR